MIENIIIPNPEGMKEKKLSFSKDGAKRLHVLVDFDRTLTSAFVDGRSIPSFISILRDGNYLTPDYAGKANALYAKYHPIEIDIKLPLKEKKKAMQEWWTAHFDLLIKSGLNKKDLKKVVESGKIKLRRGFNKFIDLLKTYNVPLVIMSSSGLAGDSILMFLEKERKLYDNIHIISNSYEWDENDNAVGVKQPIIHVMNKDETSIKNFPFFDAIKNRKNVLLMGDSLGDVGMVKGFDYDNLIKIGFLNEKIEEGLEEYKKNFDILILNDSSLDFVNGLLEEIIK